MKRLALAGPPLLVLLAALALRIPKLDLKPMHGDEAIQAVQTGQLWKSGRIAYDPRAYHGPTLAFATLPALRMSAARDFSQTREFHFRTVPATCGLLVVMLAWLFADGLAPAGRQRRAAWSFLAATVAGALAAVSPAFVYYSRYYIQETLLVLLTGICLACGWRYAVSKRRGWLYIGAASFGLMLATKETALITVGAMAGALILTVRPLPRPRTFAGPASFAGGIGVLAITGLLQQPQNLLAALHAPFNYARLGLEGGLHDHPWYFYLRPLVFFREAPGASFTEILILGLGLTGAWAALTGKGSRLARFLAFYTLLTLAVYSILPYKTPWCALGFLHGFTLLGGLGTAYLMARIPRRGSWRAIAGIALVAALSHLAWQAYRASFVFPADRRNPYVYAHPVSDAVRLGETVERLAAVHPDGADMLIRVLGTDYWPLPWYLRRLNRVGYWREIPDPLDAPVLVAPVGWSAAVRHRLKRGYETQYFGLRPDVTLELYVSPGLWSKFLAGNSPQP